MDGSRHEVTGSGGVPIGLATMKVAVCPGSAAAFTAWPAKVIVTADESACP